MADHSIGRRLRSGDHRLGRPIEFLTPKPLLPSGTVSFLRSGVPRRYELTMSEVALFTSLSATENLAVVWGRTMRDCSLPVGWAGPWRVGDITYTQADAWLCVGELAGRVVAVDVDLDRPVYPVNGSVGGWCGV